MWLMQYQIYFFSFSLSEERSLVLVMRYIHLRRVGPPQGRRVQWLREGSESSYA